MSEHNPAPSASWDEDRQVFIVTIPFFVAGHWLDVSMAVKREDGTALSDLRGVAAHAVNVLTDQKILVDSLADKIQKAVEAAR